MIDKKKQRHHELKDAASVETRWIEPIHEVEAIKPSEHISTAMHHSGDNKFTAKRENKKTHQHTFSHEHTVRVHNPKNGA